MKNKLRLHILFTIIISISFFSAAQNIKVSQLPIMNLLPSNSVYRIFQDREGYMWLGTQDGLCRYDGYRTKIFRSDFINPNLLSSNEITAFTEDYNNNIWVGTQEGLNILDKNTYSIKPHPDTTITHASVSSMICASDSTVWVGYNSGLKRYNKDLSLKFDYSYSADNKSTLPNSSINQIFEDSYQNMWVAVWGQGLFKYNKETNQFIKYPKVGNQDNPFRIYQDSNNNYWIGTWEEGIFHFNPNTISHQTYTKIPQPEWEKSINTSRFFSFTQDNNLEYIWAMSLSGLSTFKYDKDGNTEAVNTRKLFQNTNNIFSEIIKDRDGSLWIGAFSEGVFKVDFNKPSIINFPLHLLTNKSDIAPSFTSLCEDNNGDIWINQNRIGLFCYSPKQQAVKFFSEINKLKNINELKYVTHINYISGLNEIWLTNSSNSKIVRIKKEDDQIKSIKYTLLSQVTSNSGIANLIFEDNQSNVWIISDKALFVQPFGLNEVAVVKKDIGQVTSITQDNNNTIWISTDNKRIYKINLPQEISIETIKSLKFNNINNKLIDKHIQTITADLSGTVWIGMKSGSLIAYNTTNKTFTNKTIDCGLKGEAILDIIADKYNNIWITTYKKVIEYNPRNSASISYSSLDGMQINSHLKNSLFKTKDSKYIYIGGNRGYSRFSPSEHLLVPPVKTNVKITDVKIQNVSILDSCRIKKYNKVNNTLRLSPSDKNIELYFSALDYSNPEKIKYAYKLDGIDDDWIYVKEDRQFAVYSQLKKGKYIFHVKASDEHNLWSDQVTTFNIIREPAIYETTVAYIIYIIVITLVVTILIYIMINRIKLKHSIKMAQFEKNKTEELTQTKLKYFTNISHDLLTPLTIISCLIDDTESIIPKKLSQFTLMRSNVSRLKRLLQQILDFRKVENGKMQLNNTNSDIASFIKDICYNHFLPVFNKKQIKFSFHTTHKEIKAYFDADKIDKVIFNLLSNAFKYTPENGEISISLETYNENNHEYITINVSDTGIGIPPEDLENVFTRFYTNKTINASDTHGIGLSLSKDLIELHHGWISVDSKLEEGTTFTIHIPIDKGSYSPNEISTYNTIGINDSSCSNHEIIDINDIEDKVSVSTEKLSNVHILLVDDNLELLQLMKQILSRTYHVLTATNGIEALEQVKSSDIDVIISDVMMPEMDGIELCKTLKGNIETSHISVILLTAKNSINDRIECYNAGADAYISKPFEMGVLNARISNFITHKKSKQEEFKSNVELNISSLENHSMDEQFLNNAIEIIEKYLSEVDFDINTFAEELNLSKSSLYRKIKTITGLSPIEFIRNIKLKHASVMLKNSTTSISEVAYAVGFSDPKYFSSCFKSEFNITPSEFQKNHITK